MATVTLSNPSHVGAPGVPSVPDNAVAVTPNDSNVFSVPVTLYVGVTGNVVVTPAAPGAADVTFTGVPAGTILPVRVVAVKATGTTASALVGSY